MSEPEGYFTKPWSGSDPAPEEPADAAAAAEPADTAGVTAAGAAAAERPQGYFTQPWSGGSAAQDEPTAEAATPATDDPLADFPTRDVSAVIQGRISALPPGNDVYQQALTIITQGFLQCDILITLAKHSPDPRAEGLVAEEMVRERAELTEMQATYQKRSDDYLASLKRADEIREQAWAEERAQEAKRQAMRDEVFALETKLWNDRRIAADKRNQESHTEFMGYLTNKYWSSM